MEAPVPSLDPQDLQDSPDSLDLLELQVSREREDTQDRLDFPAPLASLVLKVLQDSLERRETQVMPSQSAV